MKIAIIGAGITGLTAAHRLSLEGHDITVYERSDTPGGLGTYLKIGGRNLERFYHHFFRSDRHLISLINELDIADSLKFYTVKTGVYRAGQIYPFSTPMNLLTYSPMPIIDRLRVGAVMVFFKLLPDGMHSLDQISAADYIKKWMGEGSYNTLWGPLLEGKFSKFSKQIPALWLWGRIHDRSLQLGYLDGSASVLFDALIRRIRANRGKIILSAEVTAVDSYKDSVRVTVGGRREVYDRVLLTTVSPISAVLMKKSMTQRDIRAYNSEDHLGAVCVILELKKSVQSQYWLNICQKGADVLVMIEHTNLIDKSQYGNRVVVYLANYLHRSTRRFQMTEQEIIDEYVAFLTQINPDFDRSWIIKAHLSRVPRTQTIFKKGSLATRPAHKTPVRHVYMANIDQMYPHDRNLNLGVMLGNRVAHLIHTDAS